MKKEKLTLKALFRIAKGQGNGCCEEKTIKDTSKQVKSLKNCCRLKNK